MDKRHDELFRQYKDDILPCPNIRWHEHISDIDLSWQPKHLHPNLVVEGLAILPDVHLEMLLDKMSEEDTTFFRRKRLYENRFDTSTSRALDWWMQGEKMIPPTILIYDQQFMDLVCPKGIPSTELRPADGKHRLAICCYLYPTGEVPNQIMEIR